jgi:hypothetical protein
VRGGVTSCLMALGLACGSPQAGHAEAPSPDTELALTIEPGDVATRVWARFRNQSPVQAAYCFDSVNWQLWHADGAAESGGAPFVQGVGGTRCGVPDNWSLVLPGESIFVLLEIPPAQGEDELTVRSLVRLGERYGHLRSSTLGSYRWRGRIRQIREP